MVYRLIFLFLFMVSSAHASWFFPDKSISRSKLSDPVISYGANIIFSTAAPSPIPIVTVQAKGNPFLITLEPTFANNPAPTTPVGFHSRYISANAGGYDTFLRFTRNSTAISYESISRANAVTGASITNPCSTVQIVDNPPIGSVSYSFILGASSVGVTAEINNCRLVVREL